MPPTFSFFRHALSLSLTLLFACITDASCSSTLHAASNPPDNEVPDDEDPNVDLEDVEGSLFGERQATAIPLIRYRLERILHRKLKAATERLQLSDEQIEKLEFVGNKAIRRLFEQIEEHRQRLNTARQRVDQRTDDNPLNRETSKIRSEVRTGPFEEDSMFAKVLRQSLTAEQAAEHERCLTAGALAKISRQNAVDLTRVGRIKGEIYGIAWNRDGTQVALIDSERRVEIHAFPEMSLSRAIPKKYKSFDLKFSIDENLFAIAEGRNGARIADLEAGTEIQLKSGPTFFVEFDRAGSVLVTAGPGNVAHFVVRPQG